MRLLKYLFLISLFLFSCKRSNELKPKHFSSYNQVENYLSAKDFKINETADTKDSDWITSAQFHSEDGKSGFLTLGMNGKDYYFANVPLDIWERFKSADDKGIYYNSYIKGNYNLNLNNSKSQRCKAITKKGTRCKRMATESGYCFQHSKMRN